ncbi:CMGC/DYRK/DYRK2 protein kinase [Thecamonas trahens ATCC 50062]|uniref:dual-specificity kinase n=1 Tax=Thecamonas trahens ATCC 50062 TaxID=461836 RepID=A0A0L0D983_THETB|nr:CMGC/DYRK/DYRK2 protein kinase [Thecamonas trahens ATCC 50062]KNC48904.1 CMGC/DYRK/DYRK2 protein kinase [Thecamonas trahens ATCC 50062]|eukprot:XP_013758322.1 CMGC/DYRK/DYRK2 protein kinase [Thecamonas trahens ATCC 50062]
MAAVGPLTKGPSVVPPPRQVRPTGGVSGPPPPSGNAGGGAVGGGGSGAGGSGQLPLLNLSKVRASWEARPGENSSASGPLSVRSAASSGGDRYGAALSYRQRKYLLSQQRSRGGAAPRPSPYSARQRRQYAKPSYQASSSLFTRAKSHRSRTGRSGASLASIYGGGRGADRSAGGGGGGRAGRGGLTSAAAPVPPRNDAQTIPTVFHAEGSFAASSGPTTIQTAREATSHAAAADAAAPDSSYQPLSARLPRTAPLVPAGDGDDAAAAPDSAVETADEPHAAAESDGSQDHLTGLYESFRRRLYDKNVGSSLLDGAEPVSASEPAGEPAGEPAPAAPAAYAPPKSILHADALAAKVGPSPRKRVGLKQLRQGAAPANKPVDAKASDTARSPAQTVPSSDAVRPTPPSKGLAAATKPPSTAEPTPPASNSSLAARRGRAGKAQRVVSGGEGLVGVVAGAAKQPKPSLESGTGRVDSGTGAGMTREGPRSSSGPKDSVSAGGRGAQAESGEYLTPAQVLKDHSAALTPYEQAEVLEFPKVYFFGTTKSKIRAKPGAPHNHGYDDENGDYKLVMHDHIGYRYEVLDRVGKGSFGQVVKVYDCKRNEMMALKLIRNKKRFHSQALVEVKVLQTIRDSDTQDNSCIIHMIDHFYFRNHLCVTFELLSVNLYEFIKMNNFQGFSLGLIRRFAVQMLQALRFLKKQSIIHCDLKPENVLLKNAAKSGIKVIDLGSSCFENQRVFTYIQSRFYRSPEVILGLPYGTGIDMWSLGCILAELFTGTPLLPGESEVEQMLCMQEILGVPPRSLLQASERRKHFFDSNFHPRIVPNSRGRKRYPGTKDLRSTLRCSDELFIDFLKRCLAWDPARRLTPSAALQHPWIMAALSGSSKTASGSSKAAAASAPRPPAHPPSKPPSASSSSSAVSSLLRKRRAAKASSRR